MIFNEHRSTVVTNVVQESVKTQLLRNWPDLTKLFRVEVAIKSVEIRDGVINDCLCFVLTRRFWATAIPDMAEAWRQKEPGNFAERQRVFISHFLTYWQIRGIFCIHPEIHLATMRLQTILMDAEGHRICMEVDLSPPHKRQCTGTYAGSLAATRTTYMRGLQAYHARELEVETPAELLQALQQLEAKKVGAHMQPQQRDIQLE